MIYGHSNAFMWNCNHILQRNQQDTRRCLTASRVKAKCDPVFKEPLSSNRGHLAPSYFSHHSGLSWQMRWRQLFSRRPRAQPIQSKCQPYAYVWRADRGGQLNDTLNRGTLAMRDSLRSRVKGRNWHVDILYVSLLISLCMQSKV